jgi:hypothetical protein
MNYYQRCMVDNYNLTFREVIGLAEPTIKTVGETPRSLPTFDRSGKDE